MKRDRRESKKGKDLKRAWNLPRQDELVLLLSNAGKTKTKLKKKNFSFSLDKNMSIELFLYLTSSPVFASLIRT